MPGTSGRVRSVARPEAEPDLAFPSAVERACGSVPPRAVSNRGRTRLEGGTATQAAGKRAIDAPTVAEAFRITTEQKPEHVALRNRDDSISITWGELRERVDALAGGLAKLGVGPGDTVALMFGNRPEF